MLDNIVPFALPKRTKISEQALAPDQRKLAVIPIRACTDKDLSPGMLKSLILICSYMNRSGITWVGQTTMADRLGISQQAISKHLVKLTKAGYLEILKKPMPGARHTTWRVIFDASISAQDAVSITSAIEDTRPPFMKKQQAIEAEQPDPEGQRRVAQAISKALKQPTKQEPTVNKPTDSITVREMKAAMKKAQPKATHAQPPEVVPQAQPEVVNKPLQAQPFDVYGTTPRGCGEHKEHSIREEVNKEALIQTVIHNLEVEMLIENGLTIEEIAENLDILLPLYRAEGIEPSSSVLAIGIRQLWLDVR